MKISVGAGLALPNSVVRGRSCRAQQRGRSERRPYRALHRKDCGKKAEHVNHVQDFEDSVGRLRN